VQKVRGPALAGNLDSKSAAEVLQLFRKFNREFGCAVLLVTHDPRLSERCDRTVTRVDGHRKRHLQGRVSGVRHGARDPVPQLTHAAWLLACCRTSSRHTSPPVGSAER